ncbi:MAG: ABC transporter [Spirochaetes bacterium RBG_13_51_14]|nr:MAG: ABC transporter [Spirochaetes bacterium RBG_13_51_14]
MDIIEMKNIKKDYPLGETIVHALRGVDLSVEEGGFISIIGPSGSGKTTLLNIIGCIDTATEGSVKIADEDITALDDKKLTNIRLFKVGFIFQTFNLIPVLNLLENVEFPLLLMKDKSWSRTDIRARAEKCIDDVGLKDFMEHRPAELSGGQRQRVAIARALVTKPQIVLADEPTANLDSETGANILKLMKHLNETENVTFVFSTHDPDVLQYASQVIKIKDGAIVEKAGSERQSRSRQAKGKSAGRGVKGGSRPKGRI